MLSNIKSKIRMSSNIVLYNFFQSQHNVIKNIGCSDEKHSESIKKINLVFFAFQMKKNSIMKIKNQYLSEILFI